MKKIGFHYFPDTEHYRAADCERWLPKLHQLGATWTVLQAPRERAIPEPFLKDLKAGGIEPVLHFSLDCHCPPAVDEMVVLFEAYAKWDLKYVILFDRPNLRSSWSAADWARSNLVERFLDLFLPLAEAALMIGLTPIFPPLQPGGDYWDTVFLRSALEGLKRRASEPLLSRLLLGAYAGFQGKPLDWGSGGPERWPEAQPYSTPDGSEDQRGFRIADWYLTLSDTILETRLPLLMLGISGPAADGADLLEAQQQAAGLLIGEEYEQLEPLPEQVLGGAFFLLSAPEGSIEAEHSWYESDGTARPGTEMYLSGQSSVSSKGGADFLFTHYLLLPTFDWGVADWHLEVTRAFIKKHQPTIGFSLAEARRAAQVTVLGGEENFSTADLNQLRNRGCLVRRVDGDGTKIASQLAAM